jgi:hypothetical protein
MELEMELPLTAAGPLAGAGREEVKEKRQVTKPR